MRLPDPLTLCLLVTAAVFSPAEPWSRVAGMVAASGLLMAVAEGFRRWRGLDGLGFGDVKLAAGCGAWVGVASVGPLLLVASLCALAAAACGAARHMVLPGGAEVPTGHRAIAFGPHLAFGTAAIAALQAMDLLP
jgi:leader peptidase (prepilin peptidase)/N-methyltransferase